MKKKGILFLVILLVVLIIVAGILLAMKVINDGKNEQVASNGIISLGTDIGKKQEEKKINIYQGNDRPIAVMIDNHKGAWPQARIK